LFREIFKRLLLRTKKLLLAGAVSTGDDFGHRYRSSSA